MSGFAGGKRWMKCADPSTMPGGMPMKKVTLENFIPLHWFLIVKKKVG